MKKPLSDAWLLAMLSIAGSALAAVFEQDWQSPGDGLLTFDDVSRREWLDFSVTWLEQFPGETLEDRFFQSVVAELASGGMYEGFKVATGGEGIDLAIRILESTGMQRAIWSIYWARRLSFRRLSGNWPSR